MRDALWVKVGSVLRETRGGLGEDVDACLLGLLYRTEDRILFIIQESLIRAGSEPLQDIGNSDMKNRRAAQALVRPSVTDIGPVTHYYFGHESQEHRQKPDKIG